MKVIDDTDLRTLVDNHAEFVRFIASKVGSEAIAEDLVQQSLLKAVQRRDEFTDHTNVVAWFYTVLRHAFIDHFRSTAAANRKHDRFLEELVAAGEDHQPATTELGRAVCACMTRLIPTLQDSYRDVIQRVDLGHEDAGAVAKDLGITVGNLNVRLHRARQALRKSLERSCGTCTKHGCLDCTCKPR